jgi:limonene-1,2-epoxide hydrolase
VTARRRAVDRFRREARHRAGLQLLGQVEQTTAEPDHSVVDDRLVLIFMCCHPTLSREAQVALTLRSVLGLTTQQLAKAFLTTEATMTKRIVRAKRKIVESKVPFAVPSGEEVKGRLAKCCSRWGHCAAGRARLASRKPIVLADLLKARKPGPERPFDSCQWPQMGARAPNGLAHMASFAQEIDRRRSRMESPIEVVRRFCAAWSDNIGPAELAAFFTDDAVYHNIPLDPITGRDAIANTIASFIRPGPPGIEAIEFRVINIAADGPVVMTERVDVFKVSNKAFELPVMGTFEVADGKIKAWRDYFDMNQFTSRMG